jgi:hypothetical protein
MDGLTAAEYHLVRGIIRSDRVSPGDIDTIIPEQKFHVLLKIIQDEDYLLERDTQFFGDIFRGERLADARDFDHHIVAYSVVIF